MSKDYIKKASALIAHHTVYDGNASQLINCVLGMIDCDGSPTVSPITAARAEGIETIYFCTGLTSNKVKRLDACKKASVCFFSDVYHITLIGTLEILTDSATKAKMWYDGLKHHFTGPDDTNFCVLKFQTSRYNLLIDWQEIRGDL